MNSTFRKNALKVFILAVIAVMMVCAFASCGDKTCKHDYEDTVVSATCTTEGYTIHKCKKCNDEYTDTKVAKLEHNYTEKSVTVATCQTEGERTLKCTACGDEKKETIAKNPDEHRYVHVTVVNPTCTEKGYTTHTCDCGASYKDSEVAAKNHSYTDTVTAPTCTTQGYTTHQCKNCPYSFVDTYVAMTAHTYTPVVTAPTCKEQGYTTYTCSCKKSYVDNYTAKREHDWDNGTETKAPACFIEGVMTYTCQYDDCNETKTESITALIHDFEDTVVAPGCEDQGYTLHTCKNGCGHSYKDNFQPATGHNWPSSVFSLRGAEGVEITKPATCESEGIITYTCQNDECGATKEEIIPPTGHDTEGNTATVIRVLKENETCVYIATYTTACHNEGCDGEIEVKEEEIHNYYWKITTPATCTTPGEKTYTCSLCGTAHPDEDPVSYEDAEAHNWVAGEAVGGVTRYSCECGATKGSVVSTDTSAKVDKDVFENADSIELSGAELDFGDGISNNLKDGEEVSIKVETVDDTTKNTAIDKIEDEKLKEKISNSDVYSFELKSGDQQIHDLGGKATIKIKYELGDDEDPENIVIYYIDTDGTIKEYIATYSNGYAVFETDHFSYYTVVRLTAEEMCAKLGEHKFVDTVYSPTCIRNGYTIRTCSRCGFVERVEGDSAYGHNHTTVITEPTCYTVGYTTYTCENANCDHTYVSDYVDKLEHSWDEGTEKEPTCISKGHTVYHCTNGDCEASYTENFTDFADHSWNNGSFTKTPSCTESGSRTYECYVCEAEKTEYVAAIGHNYSTTVVDPTCEAEGYTLHQCTGCDSSYKDTYTAIIPHDYKNGVCKACDKVCAHTFGAYTFNNDASCTKDGTETAQCTECDVKDTRTKVGSQTGHNYQNSVCTLCGDGCNHSFGSYTSNGDATCEHDGTKTRVCSLCQAKDTVTDEGTKLGHSYSAGVCSVCGDECAHEYEDGVCKVCQMTENNFYATFISSIITSNSFLLEIEDADFIMNMLSDMELSFNIANIRNAKIAIELNGSEPVVKAIAEGTAVSNGDEYTFKLYAITKSGIFIVKTEETHKNNVTNVTYNATPLNLTEINTIFGAIDSNASLENPEQTASYIKNILLTRFPNTIGNLFGNILEAMFTKEATDDGFILTFDAENLHNLNDKLLEGSIADALDVVLGEGAFDKIREFLIDSLDNDVKVAVKRIADYFVENDRISEEDMETLLLLMTDGEGISSIPDMTVKAFLTSMMDMPSSLITKEIIKYAADRITEISVYDIVALAVSSNGLKLKAEDIHALVDSYIDQNTDFGAVTIRTDKAGKLISVNTDLEIDLTKLSLVMGENGCLEGAVNIKASLKRNETFNYDFTALLSEFTDNNNQTNFTEIPEELKEEFKIVDNGDGTYTLISKGYSDEYIQGTFKGTYNGNPCTVIYVEEEAYTLTVNFTKSELVLFNDICLGEDYASAIKYLLAKSGEMKESFILYQRFYDDAGNLLYEDNLYEESDIRSESIQIRFIVDPVTKKIVEIAHILSLNEIRSHSYIIDNLASLDLSALGCNDAILLDATCGYCGAKGKVCYVNTHSIENVYTFVEGGTSCEDGVTVTGKCTECNTVVGTLDTVFTSHFYEETESSNLYALLKCALCEHESFKLKGDIGRTHTYTDENDVHHIVTEYWVAIKIPMMGYMYNVISMADSYVDTEGISHIDYYLNVRLDDNGKDYVYDDVYSFVVEAEETVDSCDHGAFGDPEEDVKEEDDGSVKTTLTYTNTCPSCGLVTVITYVTVEDAEGKIIHESHVETENGVTVFENTASFVYVEETCLQTYNKQFDKANEMEMISESRYDDLGRLIYQSREMTSLGVTNFTSNSFTYNDEDEEILTGAVNKMLINGKIITWISYAYENFGCGMKVTTSYHNPDGTVAFSNVSENVHIDITESYTLAPGATSCEDGVIVSVYCNNCKKTIETRIEKGDHKHTTFEFEGSDFVLMIESCVCGDVYDDMVKGYWSSSSTQYYDAATHSYIDVYIYMFESREVLVRMRSTNVDVSICQLTAVETWYYIEFCENPSDYFVFDMESKEMTGIKSEKMQLLYTVVADKSEAHTEAEKSAIEETTENGNTVTTKTVTYYCIHCNEILSEKIVKTVTRGNEFISREEIWNYPDGSYSKNTYDENNNLIREEYVDGKFSYIVESTYYSCGSVRFEYYYYNGELNQTDYYINEYHNYDDSYYYEYVNPDSDSCEDGIRKVYVCKDCGIEKKDHYETYYNHQTYKEVLWIYNHGCKEAISIYKNVCLCGEHNDINLYFDCRIEPSNQYTEDGKEYTIHRLYCKECNEFLCYFVMVSYAEAGETGCDVNMISVCSISFNLDNPLENLVEFYRTEIAFKDHDMGVPEEVFTEGTAGNGNAYTKLHTTVNCTKCDHYTEHIEYREYNSDGNLVLEETTRSEDGVTYSYEKAEYVYDLVDGKSFRYILSREKKDNKGTWYLVTYKYDFDSCTYESVTTEYNPDGTVRDTYDGHGSCHACADERYVIKDGESCEDGEVYYQQICGRCDEIAKEEWVGGYDHNYKNVVSTEVIETECGKVEIKHLRCPCGEIENVEINGDCEFMWFGDECINGIWHDIYRCCVTECAYTYSIETVHEMADNCMRYTYKVYRFGVDEDGFFSDDNCDYKLTVLDNYSRYHDTEYVTGEHDGYSCSKHVCKNCKNTISEYHYDANGNRVYSRWINDDGLWTSDMYEYDEYNRMTYLFHEEEDGWWYKYYYEYNNDSPCEYIQTRYYENEYCERYLEGSEPVNAHNYNTHYLTLSCTQHNTTLNVCSKCNHQYFDDASSPTCHNYVQNESGDGYYCSTCGMENEIGENGYFILEDLSGRYNGFAAGFYFPYQYMISDWELNFYVTISNGEQTREVALNGLKYTFLEVNASGTVIIDMDSYREALDGLLSDGEFVSEFTFAFAAYDEDSGTYLDHRLTLDEIY